MHFSALVLIPGEGDVESAVERVMAPFCEHVHEGAGGTWDWYQIGGRWTGYFDGYDPDKDPKNSERCAICGGSGVRRDMVVAKGCNGCAGTGVRVKWPTQWGRHPGDVISIEEYRSAMRESTYAVVVEGHWLSKEVWDGDAWNEVTDFSDKAQALIDVHVGRVVVVDYHS